MSSTGAAATLEGNEGSTPSPVTESHGSNQHNAPHFAPCAGREVSPLGSGVPGPPHTDISKRRIIVSQLKLTPCCNATPRVLKSKLQTDNIWYFAISCPSNSDDDCPESVG